jgi:hypothetical protein
MSKETTEEKSPVEKKKKGISSELYNQTQPIRNTVTEVVFADDVTPETLAYVQGELRRLSRVVKRARQEAKA